MSLKNLNLMIYHADLQPARGIISPGVFFTKKQKKASNESLRNDIQPGGVSSISGTPKSASGTLTSSAESSIQQNGKRNKDGIEKGAISSSAKSGILYM